MQRRRHHFDLLTNPIEILSDENGWVNGIKCIKMELGEPDASGRRRPVAIEGSEFVMDVDTVIMSLGTSPNPLISSTTEGLEVNKYKCIIADEEHGKTTKKVFTPVVMQLQVQQPLFLPWERERLQLRVSMSTCHRNNFL